jgi:sugar-specific transcriptional regulator TrmB
MNPTISLNTLAHFSHQIRVKMIEELMGLGLGYYESKALSVLLKEGLNLRELSKKAGIPFGKVYSIVKSLKEKGLVDETNSRPKLIYVENASEALSRLIRARQKQHEQIIDTIKETAALIDNGKGKASRFFEIGTTYKDNQRIQMRTFIEAEKEVLQILNIYHKPKANRPSKTAWEREIEKAVNRGVLFKCIYPKAIILPDILQKLNKSKPDCFQVKRLDTDYARCDIIDRNKVLLKLVQQDPLQFGGILFFENQKFAENLAKVFDAMWET